MDFKVLMVITIVLAVNAETDDKEKSIKTESLQPKQQQKRSQRIQMKDVVLYLTPSQIHAYNSGLGLPQHAMLQIQEVQKAEAQKHQQQNAEKNRQLEVLHNQHMKEFSELKQKLEAPQVAQADVNQNKHQKPDVQLHYVSTPQKLQENSLLSVAKPHYLPENIPFLYLFPGPPHGTQKLELVPQHEPVKNIQILGHEQPKFSLLPQNYQLVPYQYETPQQTAVQLEQKLVPPQITANHPLTEATPTSVAEQPLRVVVPEPQAVVQSSEHVPQILIHPSQHISHAVLHSSEHLPQPQALVSEPTHSFKPFTHQLSEVLPEAMPLIGHHLGSGHLQDLEIHKLQPHQIEFQNLGAHLTPEFIHSHNIHLESKNLAQLAAKDLAAHIGAKELAAQIRAKDLAAHLEAKDFAGNLDTKKHAAHIVAQHHQAQAIKHYMDNYRPHTHSKFDHFKSEQINAYLKAEESEKKFEAEKEKAEKLKARIVAQQNLQKQKIEAMRLDAHHQLEELEADVEKIRASLESFTIKPNESRPKEHKTSKSFEPSDDELHHQTIELMKQRNVFEKNPPSFQTGFKPLKFKPTNDNDKLVKEVEKILVKAHLEKQAALTRAAKENTATFKKHERTKAFKRHEESKPPTTQIDAPLPLLVPEPKPYTVPLEIINPVPFPVVKTEKVEVEKPVPYEVEKHVPVPVMKNVFVKVDKPFIVEKRVPEVITKKVPVKIPVHKPQKITILRHVWDD